MSRVNGAIDGLSKGPSAEYNMFFVFMHILLLFTAYLSSDTYMHIHIVTYITVIFWIKLKLKMTIFLTSRIGSNDGLQVACMVGGRMAQWREMSDALPLGLVWELKGK
jgi:hypothetical protein